MPTHRPPKPPPVGSRFRIRGIDVVVGAQIGKGGFGTIHLATEQSGRKGSETKVLKLEGESSIGLFAEQKALQNCLLTEARRQHVMDFMRKHQSARKHLGVPQMARSSPYRGPRSFPEPEPLSDHSGAFNSRSQHAVEVVSIAGTRFRAMLLERHGESLQGLLDALPHGEVPTPHTICGVGSQVLDALEYTHSRGYVHADIKPSNVCADVKDLNKFYLIDYGLAAQFHPPGQPNKHAAYKPDPRARHNGTLEYTSSDAHIGARATRRGDLEILGYMLLNLAGKLPWTDQLPNDKTPAKQRAKLEASVAAQKAAFCTLGNGAAGMAPKAARSAADRLVGACGITHSELGAVLADFMAQAFMLEFSEPPDYASMRAVLAGGSGLRAETPRVPMDITNREGAAKTAGTGPKSKRTKVVPTPPRKVPVTRRKGAKSASGKKKGAVPARSSPRAASADAAGKLSWDERMERRARRAHRAAGTEPMEF